MVLILQADLRFATLTNNTKKNRPPVLLWLGSSLCLLLWHQKICYVIKIKIRTKTPREHDKVNTIVPPPPQQKDIRSISIVLVESDVSFSDMLMFSLLKYKKYLGHTIIV